MENVNPIGIRCIRGGFIGWLVDVPQVIHNGDSVGLKLVVETEEGDFFSSPEEIEIVVPDVNLIMPQDFASLIIELSKPDPEIILLTDIHGNPVVEDVINRPYQERIRTEESLRRTTEASNQRLREELYKARVTPRNEIEEATRFGSRLAGISVPPEILAAISQRIPTKIGTTSKIPPITKRREEL